MKLKLLASAALVLLSTVPGILSEKPSSGLRKPVGSVNGVLKAVSDEVAADLYDGEEEVDVVTSSEDEHTDSSLDESGGDEQMEDRSGRGRAYKRGYERGNSSSGRDRGGRGRAYKRGYERGNSNSRSGRDRGSRGRAYKRGYERGSDRDTYRKGYTGRDGRDRAYGYGDCWPSCATDSSDESEMEETQAVDDSQDSSSAVIKPLESVSVEGVNGRGGHGRNNRDYDYDRDRDYDYDNDRDYNRDRGYDYDNDRGSDRDTYRKGYTGRDGRDRAYGYGDCWPRCNKDSSFVVSAAE